MNTTGALIAAAFIGGTASADLEVHTNSDFSFTFQYYNDLFGPPTGTSLNITLDAASQSPQDIWPLDENCFGVWSYDPSTSLGWGNIYFFDDADAKVSRGDSSQTVDNGYYEDTFAPVRVFKPGDTIGPDAFTGTIGDDISTFSWEGPVTYAAFEDSGFVGITLVIDGQTHYGWVLLIDDYPAGAKYQPIAWAYETEPGVPAAVIDPFTPDCPADVNGDGAVDPSDFTAWIDAYNNNLPSCDQNDDGMCTPADFTAWVNNFNSGC